MKKITTLEEFAAALGDLLASQPAYTYGLIGCDELVWVEEGRVFGCWRGDRAEIAIYGYLLSDQVFDRFMLSEVNRWLEAPVFERLAPVGYQDAASNGGIMQFDLGLQEDSTQVNGLASTPADALRCALCDGNLAAALAVLRPLTAREMSQVLLRAGFSLSGFGTKVETLANVQQQLLLATKNKCDGFALREIQAHSF